MLGIGFECADPPLLNIMMVKIHGYNEERKTKGFSDVYLLAFFFAIVAMFVFVGLLYGSIFLFNFVVRNWVWVLVGCVVAVFVLRFIRSRGSKYE